jgi:hypothetical protein
MLFSDLVARAEMELIWLNLTRKNLPEVALQRGWPIRQDHCFQRIILDNVCAGPWTAKIARKPAYRHAPDAMLEAAVNLATDVLDGKADLSAMNLKSLAWRHKLKPAAGKP